MLLIVSSIVCFLIGALFALFLVAKDKSLIHVNPQEDVVIKSSDLTKLMKGYALVAKKINPESELEE